MKKRILLSLLLIMTLLFTGCLIKRKTSLQEGTPDLTDENSFENINVMLLRGKNWERLIETSPIAADLFLRIDGSTATIPVTAELLRQFYGYSDEQVQTSSFINHSTTHQAYVNLIGGIDTEETSRLQTDLVFATPPSQEEISMAEKKGIKLDCTPIAKDGFVFITHKDNPIDSLTVGQIQKIYTGDISNWKDVGGEDQKIMAYQREKNSGSQTAMEQLVMKGKEMMNPPAVGVAFAMGDLIDAVAEYDNGPYSIGYTFSYYLHNLYKNSTIKTLKIDGVECTDETLRDGSYPFSSAYYAVIREDEPEDSQARILRDFLVSGEGQQIIAMAGYHPVSGN